MNRAEYVCAVIGLATATSVAPATPPDEPLLCPPGSLDAEGPTNPDDPWTAVISEDNINSVEPLRLQQFERYSVFPGHICGMRFWGWTIELPEGPGPITVCDEGGAVPFIIEFWTVGPDELPGTMLYSYEADAVGYPADAEYFFEKSNSTLELRVYDVGFYFQPGGCPVVPGVGYVSVRGAGEIDCVFAWMSAGDVGDGQSVIRVNDGPFTLQDHNLSYCLSGTLADLAPPFGQLDFTDVIFFLVAFDEGSPLVDFAPPFGQLDFSDVIIFLTSFSGD